MKRIQTAIVASAMIVSAGMANGQNAEIKFPTKDIVYLVPYSAGGSSDQMARAMVGYAKKYLGVNLIIENVGGGGGNVGLVKFAGYKPDGHAVVSANTTMNLQPIYGTTQYDYLNVLEPIALAVSVPIAIAVPKESPYKTIEELIAAAKAKPSSIQYGHAGVGSITHVTAELFAMEAGIKMQQVPFGSGNDALTALMGNHIQVDVAALSEVLGHHKTGTVRILAMCTDKTVENIPTLVSKGYKVDMKVTQGISTLKNVDPRIVKILDQGFGKIINDKDYQKDLIAFGMDIDYLNAADFGDFLQKQRAIFIDIVTKSGIAEMVKGQQ
jgi:tripartite-type tricarboxylate transporter receptor subunit TctC